MDFSPFFYPGSVAIIGSMGAGKLGAILAGQIQAGGYRGSLFAVNPKAEGAAGIPGYPSAVAIPTPPNLAVIVSPAATVAGVLDDCGQAGIRAAGRNGLGALMGSTPLAGLFTPPEVESVIRTRFKRGVQANLAAYAAGLALQTEAA